MEEQEIEYPTYEIYIREALEINEYLELMKEKEEEIKN